MTVHEITITRPWINGTDAYIAVCVCGYRSTLEIIERRAVWAGEAHRAAKAGAL